MRPSRYQRTAEPAAAPVTLAEAKAQIGISHTDDDTLLAIYIDSATDFCERYLNRALITQTWTAYFAEWVLPALYPTSKTSHRYFEFVKPPVTAVESVKYYDTAGVQQTVSSSNYTLELWGTWASLTFKDAYSFPNLDSDRVMPIEIDFTAGYGADGTAVPQAIKQAILLLTNQSYDLRSAVCDKQQYEPPFSVAQLLSKHRVSPQ